MIEEVFKDLEHAMESGSLLDYTLSDENSILVEKLDDDGKLVSSFTLRVADSVDML